MSVLDTKVSWFRNYYDTSPGGTVSLIHWLQSKKLQKQVEDIRALPTKQERDAAKCKLPAITPSGNFSNRNSKGLIEHSGIICIDIDHAGNEEIENYSNLKQELCKLKQVAYCGESVSGTGYFLLIPLAYPARHKEQFQALKNEFWKWGIVIDKSCGNIDRLRGASFDAEAYYNHNALPFTGIPDDAEKHYHQQTPAMGDGNVYERAIYYTEKKHNNKFEQGNRHWYIYRIAEYLATNGIDQWAASEWIYNNVLPKDEINSNCITYPYQLNGGSTQQQPAPGPLPPEPVGHAIIPNAYTTECEYIAASFEGTNEPKMATYEPYTLDWFVSEAQKCFRRSMVKLPGDYYPAFIASYRPTLRRVGINEDGLYEALKDSLNQFDGRYI